MKKGISKVKRYILMALSTVMIAVSVLLALLLVEDSIMIVDYGDYKANYFIPFYERDDISYEESEVFNDVFKSSVEEIVRMAVIKNQMETDGSYDANKAININAYANRNKSYHTKKKKVEYRLEDLIIWGNKGIDFETVSKEAIPFEIPGDSMEVVASRYNTVEGKDLLSYANSAEEYDELVNNLIETTSDLFSNYREYVYYSEKYGVGKTNVLYCVQMSNEGKIVRFTNMEVISSTHTTGDITGLFNKQFRYINFDPTKMTLKTNSELDAMAMQSIIGPYNYAFSDSSRIWIGFDNNYSAADGYAVGKECYEQKSEGTDGVVLVVAIWVAFFAYLSIFIFLMVEEGRPYYKKSVPEEERENKYVLKKVDHMPIEFMLVLAFGVIVVDLLAALATLDFVKDHIYQGVSGYVVLCAAVVFVNITFMPMVLCFIRRFKAHNLGENSCFIWIIEAIRKSTIDAYDHGHALVRTWIPYIIYLLVNLILLMFAPIGLIIAIILDVIVGTYLYKNNKERQQIVKSINIISQSDIKHQMDTTKMHGDNLELANAVNNIGNGIRKAVEKSMKDEKMKADLITNVSHDIKTPLTSIINYVDLLKRENIEDEKISGYIAVLDQKSQRLKQLTDDLVEASKISSGNIVLNFERINIVELVNQSIGEFEDKFGEHGLKCRFNPPEKPIYISADSRSMFRIIENLYNNIYKYALQGTRVYIDLEECGVEGATRVQLSVKNISESQLNMSADELLERFKQGDESRKTEGSGLGLSITKSLTEAMNGQFDLLLDGDLFKVILTFNVIN